jgi:hypothetical protein
MSNFQEDSFQKRIKSKEFRTLFAVWLSLLFISFLILFFTPDSILYLYMLISSLIILADAAFIKILYQYPDPIERANVEFILGFLFLIGILFSWLIWMNIISMSFARNVCMSAGMGVSIFTGIVLIRYFTQVKVRQ